MGAYYGDKPLALYYGDRHPLTRYYNGHRIAGWRWDEQSAPDMTFEHTYNDRVDVVALGRGQQVQTVQGKNICPVAAKTVTGTGNSGGWTGNLIVKNIPVVPGQSYVASFVRAKSDNMQGLGAVGTRYVHPTPTSAINHTQLWAQYLADYPATSGVPFVIPDGMYYISFTFGNNVYVNDGQPGSLSVSNFQLELGSTATPYAPFVPNSPSPDYPSPIISSAGIIRSEDRHGNGVQRDMGILRAIPDGTGGWAARDELYVERVGGEWHLMRRQRVGRGVLTGAAAYSIYRVFENTIRVGSNTVFMGWGKHPPKSRLTCTHLPYWHDYVLDSETAMTHDTTGQNIYLSWGKARLGYVDGDTNTQILTKAQAYYAAQHAAGTPVTVDYILAAPIITDLGSIDLPTYYPFTRVLVSGDYPPDVTARCRVVDL